MTSRDIRLCAAALVAISPISALASIQPSGSSALAGIQSGPCATSSYAIGYRIIPFKDSRNAALMYPTSSAQTPFAYSKDISTTLAFNGAPLLACGRFPLVVFSHGLLGCGAQSIFFTEALARHGYVVVAPDYLDARMCRVEAPAQQSAALVSDPSLLQPHNWTPAAYEDRMVDTEEIVAMMLQDATVGRIIDRNRIGIAGHSMGGYTALGIAGGWPSWRDPRVKAALLMSPYSIPFNAEGTLGGVSVPLMYQGAQGDIAITPFLEGPKGSYALSNAPKYFLVLRGGNHLTWTNAVCGGQTTVADCVTSVPSAQLIVAYGIAFFDKYLKGLSEPLLTGDGAGLASYTFKQ